jgi:poly(3-hydroxyalkanoate) synthetase
VDAALVVSEWGFDPARIDVPVYLWHGGQDTEAPVTIGHLLAEAIPGCQAQFLAGEGHISLIVNHAESILRHT